MSMAFSVGHYSTVKKPNFQQIDANPQKVTLKIFKDLTHPLLLTRKSQSSRVILYIGVCLIVSRFDNIWGFSEISVGTFR